MSKKRKWKGSIKVEIPTGPGTLYDVLSKIELKDTPPEDDGYTEFLYRFITGKLALDGHLGPFEGEENDD